MWLTAAWRIVACCCSGNELAPPPGRLPGWLAAWKDIGVSAPPAATTFSKEFRAVTVSRVGGCPLPLPLLIAPARARLPPPPPPAGVAGCALISAASHSAVSTETQGAPCVMVYMCHIYR